MRAFINASDKKYKYSNKSILKIADELAYYFNVSGDYELGIHFCSYTKIRKLNSEYRNKNTATDVLSFAVNEPGEIKGRNFKSGRPMLLGDIFLCPDYILKNNVMGGKQHTGTSVQQCMVPVALSAEAAELWCCASPSPAHHMGVQPAQQHACMFCFLKFLCLVIACTVYSVLVSLTGEGQ